MKPLPWILFAVAAMICGACVFTIRNKGTEIVHLLADNRALDAHIDELKSQLATAQTIESLKSLPLNLTVLPALMGSGKKVRIQNRGDAALRLTITVQGASTDPKQMEMVLDPNQLAEVGHLQGWAFVDGDTISISSPGYKVGTWKIQ